MKVVGVIPARWASTRFPGKILADLCGKPLIQWTFERASQAKCLDSLTVATDDERIRKAVEAFGGAAVMTRADHPSGTDRVAEAAANTDADVIINIQGDEPLIDPALIDRLASVMDDESDGDSLGTPCDMSTAASPIEDETHLNDPSVVKVVWDEHDNALFFSRSVIPFDRDNKYNTRDSMYWRHLGIYAYHKDFLNKLVASPTCLLEEVEKLEQLRALYLGAKIRVIQTNAQGRGVDTPDDLTIMEKLISKMGDK